jgi:hypothetical protein
VLHLNVAEVLPLRQSGAELYVYVPGTLKNHEPV